MDSAAVIREARQRARLTQNGLAIRLGSTQPVVARLESGSANPTIRTLERALHATGHRLRVSLEPVTPSVDESLIRQHLERSPAERISGIETMYREAREIARAGERLRGELA